MFKVLSFGCKFIPSVWYVYKMNIFLRDTVSNMPQWLKWIMTYGLTSALVLGFLLYWFYFRDKLIRLKAKEQFENEEANFTVEVQTKRLFRVYISIGLLGAFIGLLTYYYKPYIVTLSIKFSIIYAWFILGEVFRIVDIANKENKRMNKTTEKKGEN